MFCTSCGQEITDGARFCASCGVKVALPTKVPGSETVAHEGGNSKPDAMEKLVALDEVLDVLRQQESAKGFLTDEEIIESEIAVCAGLEIPQTERLVALIGVKPGRKGGLLVTDSALYFHHRKMKKKWRRMPLKSATGLTVRVPTSFAQHLGMSNRSGYVQIVGRGEEWAKVCVCSNLMRSAETRTESCADVLNDFLRGISSIFDPDAYKRPENAQTLDDFIEAKHCSKVGIPCGTLGLVATCVTVYLIEYFRFGWFPSASELLAMGGSSGSSVWREGELWRLITSCFLHGNVLHAAVNMWCLWVFGSLLEKMIGTRDLICAFAICGIGGAIASSCWNAEIVSVGAAGAVFGLAGALVPYSRYFCARENVPWYLISDVSRRTIAFFFVNLIVAARVNQSSAVNEILGGPIDIPDYFGGFIIGLVLGLILVIRHKRR